MSNPQTINEKLLWLEFYTDTSRWTILSDKYQVREYLREKGLEHLLVKLYGMYTDAMDIDFEHLPDSFVIKTNNGYGTVMLVKDKNALNITKLRHKMDKWLKSPYGYVTGEPHYTRIKPCLIVEELLPLPEGQSSLVDYKMWCLNGKVYKCFVCTNRSIKKHKAHFCLYDIPEWKRRPELMAPAFANDDIVERPGRLDDMIRYAEILSAEFPLVRTDFYEVNGKVYFGEMTFTSNGGRMTYFCEEELLRMGQQLDISNLRK